MLSLGVALFERPPERGMVCEMESAWEEAFRPIMLVIGVHHLAV